VLGRPSRPKDRTQPTKLEITFGHAFDRREVSSSKSAMHGARRIKIVSTCKCFIVIVCAPSRWATAIRYDCA
jgi:hypothetical protein